MPGYWLKETDRVHVYDLPYVYKQIFLVGYTLILACARYGWRTVLHYLPWTLLDAPGGRRDGW
jgi:hypothetical protein